MTHTDQETIKFDQFDNDVSGMQCNLMSFRGQMLEQLSLVFGGSKSLCQNKAHSEIVVGCIAY